MKTITAVLVALLLCSPGRAIDAVPILAGRVTIAGEATLPTDEQEISALDDAWAVAEVKHDAKALRRLLDERYQSNLTNGTTMDREAAIAAVLAWDLVSEKISERTVLLDGNTAIVFATATVGHPQGEAPSLYRYTATYIKRAGGWRVLALHMTKRP